jgi:hypothetical protein
MVQEQWLRRETVRGELLNLCASSNSADFFPFTPTLSLGERVCRRPILIRGTVWCMRPGRVEEAKAAPPLRSAAAFHRVNLNRSGLGRGRSCSKKSLFRAPLLGVRGTATFEYPKLFCGSCRPLRNCDAAADEDVNRSSSTWKHIRNIVFWAIPSA